jgi:serine/threonine protein kinase
MFDNTIGTYEVRDVIASGTHTAIYKATSQSGSPVAIKVPTSLSSTAIEHYYLSRIAHPSIIELLDTVQTPLGPGLVIPYAAGDDLFNVVVEGNGLDEDSVKAVIYSILTALKYLHSIGLVHCDVKPENIFLLRAGSPQSAVLADFGYARPAAGMPAGAEFLGSACYASPEAWKGEPCTEKVDLWALGVTAYVAALRCFPFRAPPDSAEVEEETMAGLPSWDNPEGFASVSSEFRDFIAAMLTVDPKRRPSAEEAMNCTWFDSLRNPDAKEGRNAPVDVQIGETDVDCMI